MNISDRLIQVVEILEQRKVTFAIAGGIAASLYRENERFTKDLDFLILAEPNSLVVAKEILQDLELTPHEVTDAQLAGGPAFKIKRRLGEVWIVLGRKDQDPERSEIGVDFILPSMPWFNEAITRSQNLRINFGPVIVPCLSAEDVILAKLFAYNLDSTRPYDLDDIQSIFKGTPDLDLSYLSGQMTRHNLALPKSMHVKSPAALVKISKALERQARKLKKRQRAFP